MHTLEISPMSAPSDDPFALLQRIEDQQDQLIRELDDLENRLDATLAEVVQRHTD